MRSTTPIGPISDLRVCELFTAGGFGGGNEDLWWVSGLTSKVIGKGFISGLYAFAALSGDRASDIRGQLQPVNAAQRNRLWVTTMSRAMLMTLVTPRAVKRCIPYFIRNWALTHSAVDARRL